jgi:hypothetical protein
VFSDQPWHTNSQYSNNDASLRELNEGKLVLSAVSVSGDVSQGFSWWRKEWPVEKLFLDLQNARFQDVPWWVGQIPPSSGT